MNTLQAINHMLSITLGVAQLQQQLLEASRMIATAQAEGRDLTAEEWATIVVDADAAESRARAALQRAIDEGR